MKVVELVQPQYFVMENVPNLLTAEKGYFKKEIEEMTILSSSERIDGIIAKVYHLSRSQSIELFRGKKIYVNSRLCENNSYQMKDKDVVSVRGYGKFVYNGVNNLTKKGKLSVNANIE